MHGATHAVWGAAAGLGAALIMQPDPAGLVTGTLTGAISGLVPDWLQVNVPGVKQIKGMFGHRGFSHWIWTPLIISLLIISSSASMPSRMPVAAFFCAWASHIALDAFADGAPAFWPFGRLTLAHIKTGGKVDRFIGGAGIVMIGVETCHAVLRFV